MFTEIKVLKYLITKKILVSYETVRKYLLVATASAYGIGILSVANDYIANKFLRLLVRAGKSESFESFIMFIKVLYFL